MAGWVANVSDGRVQLEIEGTSAEIDAFVMAIEERMHGYVRKTERSLARRTPQSTGPAHVAAQLAGVRDWLRAQP